MKLWENLRELRNLKGLTQKELAVQLDIEPLTYSRYERGEREPPIKTLCKLAEIYDTSVDEIIGLENYGYQFKRAVDIWNELNYRVFIRGINGIKLETSRVPRQCDIKEEKPVEVLTFNTIYFPDRASFIAFTNKIVQEYVQNNYAQIETFFLDRINNLETKKAALTR